MYTFCKLSHSYGFTLHSTRRLDLGVLVVIVHFLCCMLIIHINFQVLCVRSRVLHVIFRVLQLIFRVLNVTVTILPDITG